MIYGLYLSASGVMSSSHKQDVIANNLANAETTGFKRDLPLFQQRLTEAQAARIGQGHRGWSDGVLEQLGGGLLLTPTQVDMRQGDIDPTGGPLDVAIEGDGYFAVRSRDSTSGNNTALTRAGNFMVDHDGKLVLGSDRGQQVLDVNRQPIRLVPDGGGAIRIGPDGVIHQGQSTVGQIGVFAVPNPQKLSKQGGMLLGHPDASQLKRSQTAVLHGEATERSNVDPTTELTELMKTQRLLEANANMIRTQDQTLGKVLEVGKI